LLDQSVQPGRGGLPLLEQLRKVVRDRRVAVVEELPVLAEHSDRGVGHPGVELVVEGARRGDDLFHDPWRCALVCRRRGGTCKREQPKDRSEAKQRATNCLARTWSKSKSHDAYLRRNRHE